MGHIQGMDIRERIESVIEANPEMTVRNVSLAAGLSDSALHKFLSGATDSLTLKTVDKLAEALGVDARWLAYGEGTPERATEVERLLGRLNERQQRLAVQFIEEMARTGTAG